MPDFKETQRQRFWELTAQIEAIEAKSGPMREARDAEVRDMRAREKTHNDAIAKAEEGLFDLKVEQGFLARALVNVGERPAADAAAE